MIDLRHSIDVHDKVTRFLTMGGWSIYIIQGAFIYLVQTSWKNVIKHIFFKY